MSDSHSSYDDTDTVERETRAGRHREVIGGMWEELGSLQLDLLVGEGLRPSMRLLDVGCGCLRAGVHLVAFLESGNYYGVDSNESLLDAGWEVELPQDLRPKLPRTNLKAADDFDVADFGVVFDMGLAQSVFTHLPLNHLRLCLERLAPVFVRGAQLFTSYFECSERTATSEPILQQPGGIRTFGHADPYHYRGSDLHFAAKGLPWTVDLRGDWNHPRGQRLAVFARA